MTAHGGHYALGKKMAAGGKGFASPINKDIASIASKSFYEGLAAATRQNADWETSSFYNGFSSVGRGASKFSRKVQPAGLFSHGLIPPPTKSNRKKKIVKVTSGNKMKHHLNIMIICTNACYKVTYLVIRIYIL